MTQEAHLIRDESGWKMSGTAEHFVDCYTEALIRYLNIFDPVFAKAQSTNEFEFLMSLFNIKSMEDAGWNPYETTLQALRVMSDLHKHAGSGEAQRHLELWLYGHITEASEPYELLMNLLSVIAGDTYHTMRFPPGKNGKPQSPGAKIKAIEAVAIKVGLNEAIVPFQEIWNRFLRNSIFHADYALFGSEVRTRNPLHVYTHEEISTLSNRALAFIESLSGLRKLYIGSYSKPKIIPTPDYFAPTNAVVLVAEGYGAVGMQAALTAQQIQQGQILWRLGLFTPEERRSLDQDPTVWLLPKRETTDDNEGSTNS